MNTTFALIVIAVMLVVLMLLISRRSRSKTSSRRSKRKQTATASADSQTTQWRAVKIKPNLMSCSAVQELAYTRFLASECPSLPLPDCSQKECQCKYIHLDDRRSGGDRRVELGDLGKFLPVNSTERRHIAGRRVNDLAA